METLYQKCPARRGEIRLLTVRQSTRSSLFQHTLHSHFQIGRLDGHVPAYTAISYSWGDAIPVRTASTRQLEVRFSENADANRGDAAASLPLSQTLADLLHSLLRNHASVTVWVDALCINQDDKSEKGIQVDQMGDVYSRAEQVLVWLGARTPTSTAAFRFMQSKRGLAWPDGWNKLDKSELRGIDSVFSLLERPWFRRLWVIQEVALSPHVVVACGDDRIDFKDFETCVYAVWSFCEGLVDRGADDAALLGLWSITRLLLVRDSFHKHGAVTWENLLQAASQRLATDSRDKVFAFRSLADKGRPLPCTDYTTATSVEKVYTDTAVALLCNGECLDLLALAGKARNGDSSLPSWVPDHREFTWTEPFALADGMGWSAGGPFQAPPTVVSALGLRILVKPVDRVGRVCPRFMSWDVLQQQAVILELVDLRSSFRLQLSEREWFDVLAASLTFGLDIDDVPADEQEYRQYFDEWYQWLMSSTSQSDLPKIKHNKFHRTIGPRLDNWRAFLTDEGFFGVGPPELEVGDMVSVAPGCRLPLVLRPVGQAASSNVAWGPTDDMTLISWCFLQGMMDGEAFAKEGALSRVCLQ
jgi:hypothetical protein